MAPFNLAPINAPKDVPQAMSGVLALLTSGTLTPAEGSVVVGILRALTDTLLAVQSSGGGTDPTQMATRLRLAAAAMDEASGGCG